MECHILQTTSAGDAMYASMTPIDTPVAIAALVDGTMVEVDNPLRIDALYPTAQAICAELDLALLQTPVTLTVAGEVDGVEEGKWPWLCPSPSPDSSPDPNPHPGPWPWSWP